MSIVVSVNDCLYDEGERFDFEIESSLEPIDYMGNIKFNDLKLKGFYISDSKTVRFIGEVFVSCLFECDRCLREFSKDFVFKFSEVYSFNAEEEDLLISRNNTVDLQPLVYDTIITSLPIERLCKKDCKGLCAHCGIDKNFSSCSCEDVDEDNPFAILRGLVD